MNKRKIICYTLSVLVIFLFSYSLIGTAEFLNIHSKDNEQEENTETNDTDKSSKDILNMEGNTSSNLSQHYQDSISSNFESNGSMVITKKYIYKTEKINNKYVISQIDKKTEETFPLISGYECRNLINIGDYIYCIVKSQNSEEIIVDKIAKVSLKGEEIQFFESTESLSITSMVSDGDSIYYTKSDNSNIYKINLTGDIYSYIYTLENSNNNPYLFGIKDSKLYYVDGYEMAALDLYEYTKTNISYQYSSKNLNPILVDNNIYAFDTLSKTSLSTINLDDNSITNIFGPDELKVANITLTDNTNINYYKNYLFFNKGTDIYYISLKDKKINLLKDVKTTSKVLYFDDNSIITEEDKYGACIKNEITWLLAK